MDLLKLGDKFLNTLYFLSNSNIANGSNIKQVAQVAEISPDKVDNIIHYLRKKGHLEEVRYDDDLDVILSSAGIDYILQFRTNRTYKTIKFKASRYIPPASKLTFGFLFWYDLKDEEGSVEYNTLSVSISDVLSVMWQLDFGEEINNSEKILLYYGKNRIIEKLKEGTLNQHEEIVLMTTNSPHECPFNPINLQDTHNALFEVEVEAKNLSLEEELNLSKLAPLIIETRDNINSLFREKHGANLLLLNEERSTLNYFKTANSIEEFFFRIASLAEVSRNLNIAILRTLTNIQDTDKKSVELLEIFIKQKAYSVGEIINILQNFGRLRQGFPNHIDNPKFIQAIRYFNLTYPIKNFQDSWTKLLEQYLKCLKELFDILNYT